ncbi:leucyl aminopeptidase family protein [Brevundimonas sp. 2R-24]|uniref:Leucyl aminopeptidase family protein n=1 Tax=Peiella sedimenti TaxID=3061083 RepID=A0ABT8SJT3_9CAUL|nr:leucyl aminopeptidase family protein [Caulobacteraceae bacterium XZ-24]
MSANEARSGSGLHQTVIASAEAPIRLRLIEPDQGLEGPAQAWATAHGFKGQAGRVLPIADPDGHLVEVLAGTGPSQAGRAHRLGRSLPARLPAGDYRVEGLAAEDDEAFALGWALGGYAFDRYKAKADNGRARLVAPEGVDLGRVARVAEACALIRQMVDTPASDMGPLQIETIAREIAEANGAEVSVITGPALLEQNYPAVHAVGRAATEARAPRIIEFGWRLDQTELPLVALVGKGVCFDSGGLDLKPAAGMRNMKKDMGGAAHALGLARMVMEANLPVRLVVLVAAVENMISGEAFRPGDVVRTRKGLTVEIGNTDAEGRVILSDALQRAGELQPDLTLDFATLTGAARIALGPELPPFYTDDETLAGELQQAAAEVVDPLWRMPLWSGYREAVEADIADLRNDSADWAQAGSVTAALFLQRFAPETGSWCHFDIFAWNPRSRPGWPTGGEVQGVRACLRMLERRFGGR